MMAYPETRTYLLRAAREHEFDCVLCNNQIQGRDEMVKHLETNACTPAGEQGTLVELQRHMMLQNVKWRQKFLKWQYFREVIRENRIDEFTLAYPDECLECESFAEHQAGGCETRVKRGMIVSHLADETTEHYQAWAAAEYEINEMARNKEQDERIEATSMSDLIYMADELWPEMREAEKAEQKKYKEKVEKFTKEMENVFESEQLLFERLDEDRELLAPHLAIAAARARQPPAN